MLVETESKADWDIPNKTVLEGDESGSYFSMSWGEMARCPGKAIVDFSYLSHSDRQIIEQKLGKDFYGVPYTGRNT